LAIVLIVGCGGGGGSHPSAAAVSSLPHASASTNAVAAVSLTLTIPKAGSAAAKARRVPAYISSSATQAAVSVNGGTATMFSLLTSSSYCQTESTGLACTLTVPAPITSGSATDTFTLVLSDASGHQLSAGTLAAAVTEGAANVTLPLVLGGVPAYATISAPGLQSDVANTASLIVTAYDADGNIIVGPADYATATGGSNELRVSLAEAESQVTLTSGPVNGTPTSGSPIVISSPDDTPTISLASPADILGVTFSITDGSGSVLAAPASAPLSRSIALPGTLTVSIDGTLNSAVQPDVAYDAPVSEQNLAGLPATAAFLLAYSYESESGYVGYYDAGSHAAVLCEGSGSNESIPIAITDEPGGLLIGTATQIFPNQGASIGMLTPAALLNANGSTCPALSNKYALANANLGFLHGLTFDEPDGVALLATDTNATPSPAPDRISKFSSGNAVPIATPTGTPYSLVSAGNGNVAYLDSGTGDVILITSGPTVSQVSTSGTYIGLGTGPDGNLYALSNSGSVYLVGSGSLTLFSSATDAKPLPGGPSGVHPVTIGSDGYAYVGSTDGYVSALAPTSSQTTLLNASTLAGTTHEVESVYRHNGAVYAVSSEDGEVYRIHR